MVKKQEPPATDKRKVTMTTYVALGPDHVEKHEATDYVPLDILDSYVADAHTRWQYVEVGDAHDSGPGGDDGETHYAAHLARKEA